MGERKQVKWTEKHLNDSVIIKGSCSKAKVGKNLYGLHFQKEA